MPTVDSIGQVSKMNKCLSIFASDLPSRAVTVYLYLEKRANKESTCFPAIPTIAKDTKLSVSTVKRALNDLVKAGFISKENRYRDNGGKSSNLYYLSK